MSRTLLAVALAICLCQSSSISAGEWLGGQYWGQISGCGNCGGSLYGRGVYGAPCECCDEAWQQDSPVPPQLPHSPTEYRRSGVDAIPDPDVPRPPVIRTSHVRPASTLSKQSNDDILPIAPTSSPGDVKIITHVPQRERLTPESIRIVAPNAWSGPLYR